MIVAHFDGNEGMPGKIVRHGDGIHKFTNGTTLLVKDEASKEIKNSNKALKALSKTGEKFTSKMGTLTFYRARRLLLGESVQCPSCRIRSRAHQCNQLRLAMNTSFRKYAQ